MRKALITGMGRRRGIGWNRRRLAVGGWDLALSYWGQYDIAYLARAFNTKG
jgi:hypothetical protein